MISLRRRQKGKRNKVLDYGDATERRYDDETMRGIISVRAEGADMPWKAKIKMRM